MQRFLPAAAIGAVAALVVAGAVWLAADDGPFALKVGETEISRSTFDDELEQLHDYPIVASSIVQQQLGPFEPGSLPSDVTRTWLYIRALATLAHDELGARGERVTAADRDAVGFPTTGAYGRVPKDFRRLVVGELSALGALQRVLGGEPDIAEQARAACPSGRYVSHILVPTEAEAAQIKQQLDEGAVFEELARTASTDTGTAQQGGNLGCLDELGALVEPFASNAQTAPVGVVSEPFQTEFGFHVLLVTDEPLATDVSAVALASIRAQLARSDVEIDPRYGRWDRANGQVLPPNASTATQATANG